MIGLRPESRIKRPHRTKGSRIAAPTTMHPLEGAVPAAGRLVGQAFDRNGDGDRRFEKTRADEGEDPIADHRQGGCGQSYAPQPRGVALAERAEQEGSQSPSRAGPELAENCAEHGERGGDPEAGEQRRQRRAQADVAQQGALAAAIEPDEVGEPRVDMAEADQRRRHGREVDEDRRQGDLRQVAGKTRTKIGPMTIAGTVNRVMFTPRKTCSTSANRLKTRAARIATVLPMRKPAAAVLVVAQMCADRYRGRASTGR